MSKSNTVWFRKCAVTGGNGFLGTHVVQQLLATGVEVVATVRNPTEQKVKHLNVLPGASERLRIVNLDLLGSTRTDFAKAFVGCDVLMHTASPFFYNVTDAQKELIDPALKGTKKVLSAAKDAGINNIVLTSSVAAVSAGVKPTDPIKGYQGIDWSPIDKLRGWNAWYPLSKTLAEKAAWSMATELNLTLSAICPCQIFGPLLQPSINTSSKKIYDLLNGQPNKIPNTFMTYVDVRDVAALHIAAASAKVSGKRIMAVAGALHHREICALLKAFVPTSNVPTLVEGDAEDGSSLAEAPAPSAQYDVSEAKLLGINFRSVRETFEETVASLPRD